ncbi:unnamed protein product [Lymnaea stagnalis]|uniref:Uncharacterized protein n=1 Tax=Lymnaea stagnalis TaxID=6523 RepID=A0AAV2HMF2_LYMST
MSAPSLYTTMSSSPTPSSSIKAGSSASSPPIISRRGTLVTRHDFLHGRVIEFPDSSGTEMSSERRAVRDDLRSKIWLSNDQNRSDVRTARTKRLETMNLRGARQATKSVLNNSQSLSKKSDSVNDSGQASSSQEALPGLSYEDRASELPTTESINLGEDRTLTADDTERRQNFEKCRNWIDTLPNKFSSMHIVQERAPLTHDY